MAQKGNGGNKAVVPGRQPRCHQIARRGIHDVEDFAAMMSALMSDVIEGTITPAVANATCNAGGKLLKAVEMQQRYGRPEKEGKRTLALASPRKAA